MHTDETSTDYTATKKYNLNFPSLRDEIDADVIVVSGGFTGIHTALELAEKGATNTVLLEARYLGFGGTSRNGGQVMAGIGHDLTAIERHVGRDGIQAIFEMSDMGPQIMRERIEKYGIDADFCSGYGNLAYNARHRVAGAGESNQSTLGRRCQSC